MMNSYAALPNICFTDCGPYARPLGPRCPSFANSVAMALRDRRLLVLGDFLANRLAS